MGKRGCAPLLLFLTLALVLPGCVRTRPAERRPAELAPPSSRMLRKALARAEVCSAPAPAEVRVSPRFRYGCFCGGGYPGLARVSGKRPAELSWREREKLVARYYAVKPVDAIDAACMAHDVCWIWNGRPDVACNDAFAEEMKELRQAFRHPRQRRCSLLALDLQRAANSVFPGASYDPSIAWADRAAKLLLAPVAAIQAAIAGTGALWDRYPHPGERCDPGPD